MRVYFELSTDSFDIDTEDITNLSIYGLSNNSESGFQLNGLSVGASVFELSTDRCNIDAEDISLSIFGLSNNSELDSKFFSRLFLNLLIVLI